MSHTQLGMFGEDLDHYEVTKQQQELAYREYLRNNPDFARRALVLGCLNRRGPLAGPQIEAYLGLAQWHVQQALVELQRAGCVDTSGEWTDVHGDKFWVWRAMTKREEVA